MIFRPTKKTIKRFAELLLKGEVISFPTETVYGLGANAFDPVAVEKIFKIKKRPFFDPLIVHISDYRMFDSIVENHFDKRIVEKLIKRFWPGPLTLVLPKSPLIPDIVTAGLKTVAVRMPDNPVALSLIRESKVPVAAPSANRFGMISPVTAIQVQEQLSHKIPILDGGRTSVGVESTIIDLSKKKISILRPGGISVSEIEKVLNQKISLKNKSIKTVAPGQLKNHYSTFTPLFTVSSKFIYNLLPYANRLPVILIFWKKPSLGNNYIKWFSKDGDSKTVCRNLFITLHSADSEKKKAILVEIPLLNKRDGFNYTILDRLTKASRGNERSLFVRTLLHKYI